MKILILSNSPLSYATSNGRTMLNMLLNFKKDEILNIFINGNDLALDKANFYKINEKRLIKNQKPFGKYIRANENNQTFQKAKKKTVFKCLIRSFLWHKKSLIKEIFCVVNEYKPDRIIVQCGDSDFLIDIACLLSKKLNAKLIAYNSEDYIFKNWNYIEKKERKSLFFSLFLRKLRRSYDILYNSAKSFVYLTDCLFEEYLEAYPNHNGHVIYNSSFIKSYGEYCKDGPIVYSGNLGVGRAEELIILSDIIYKIFGKKLTICSLTNDTQIIDRILKSDYIDFLGKLDYQENLNLLMKSSLIVHVESLDKYYKKDTRNAFSTKIADSLSLGLPFFVLAPSTSATFNYISKYSCAFISTDYKNAKTELLKIYNDETYLMSKINKAKKVAFLNHDSTTNSNKFYRIIEEN